MPIGWIPAHATLRFALRSLRARLLESLLLLFALTIAYGGAGLILSVLTSFRARVAEDLSGIGLRVINVHPALDFKSLLTRPLAPALLGELAAVTGGEAAGASLETALIASGGAQHAALAIATTPVWSRLVEMRLLEGRFFDEDERDACVLDEWVARALFGEPPGAGSGGNRLRGAIGSDSERPIVGREVEATLGGAPMTLRVVGVARDPFRIRQRFASLEGAGASRSILVRMMEHKSIYLSRAALPQARPLLLGLVGVPPGRKPEEEVVKVRARLKELGSEAIAWDRKSWADRLVGAAGDMTAIASVVWVLVLAITALMAAVIIAVAVRGRYREIAVRRIEGATRAWILAQLLCECGILSLVAGLLGHGLARGAGLWLEAEVLGWPLAFTARDLTLLLAAGAGLALLTTALPAFRAASQPPVAVLRER